jgi:hypothetical protein
MLPNIKFYTLSKDKLSQRLKEEGIDESEYVTI